MPVERLPWARMEQVIMEQVIMAQTLAALALILALAGCGTLAKDEVSPDESLGANMCEAAA